MIWSFINLAVSNERSKYSQTVNGPGQPSFPSLFGDVAFFLQPNKHQRIANLETASYVGLCRMTTMNPFIMRIVVVLLLQFPIQYLLQSEMLVSEMLWDSLCVILQVVTKTIDTQQKFLMQCVLLYMILNIACISKIVRSWLCFC